MKLITIIIVLVFFAINVSASSEICNISIEIKTSKVFYDNTSVDFRFKLSNKTNDYKIEYWVEDVYGNIVKTKRNTTNLNEKSFNPKTSGVNAFLIKARFAEINCINIQNTVFETMVLFKGDLESNNQCCACLDKKGFYYEIIEIPETIRSGEDFLVKIDLENNDEQEHEIKLWSYIYRGSKVYSESRETNIQQLTLQPNTSIVVELSNKAYADPGNYKLKIKLNKDNQKTNKEITTNISVVEKQKIDNSQRLRISKLYFDYSDKTRLFAVINNSFKQDFNIDVELNSIYSFQKKRLLIESESDALVIFDIELTENQNPFFVKLYLNDTLIDINEIIIEDNGKTSQIEKPFQLVAGDLVFSNSTTIYESSSAKSIKIAVYLFLVLSVGLNCFIIYKKGFIS